jgi:hypothetical protein
MTETQQQADLPWAAKWGRRLLGASLAALAVGGTAVEVFFPWLKGRGLDALTLSILIPIWAVGVAGILLLLAAWVRHPGLETRLEVETPRRPDGKVFGPFTKAMVCFGLVVIWLALQALWAERDALLPLWKKVLLCYCATAYCWSLFYLTALYASDRHHATTTYLNHFGPLIGILLLPLTWPLLIVLNGVVAWRQGKPAARRGRRSPPGGHAGTGLHEVPAQGGSGDAVARAPRALHRRNRFRGGNRHHSPVVDRDGDHLPVHQRQVGERLAGLLQRPQAVVIDHAAAAAKLDGVTALQPGERDRLQGRPAWPPAAGKFRVAVQRCSSHRGCVLGVHSPGGQTRPLWLTATRLPAASKTWPPHQLPPPRPCSAMEAWQTRLAAA